MAIENFQLQLSSCKICFGKRVTVLVWQPTQWFQKVCIISGGGLSHCVLPPKVRINSYSSVSDSILMENVEVGRYSQIRKAIIDKNVVIPPLIQNRF